MLLNRLNILVVRLAANRPMKSVVQDDDTLQELELSVVTVNTLSPRQPRPDDLLMLFFGVPSQGAM